MLCTPKPNGFADHYPYEKWLAIIGNINPTFSGPNPYVYIKIIKPQRHKMTSSWPLEDGGFFSRPGRWRWSERRRWHPWDR